MTTLEGITSAEDRSWNHWCYFRENSDLLWQICSSFFFSTFSFLKLSTPLSSTSLKAWGCLLCLPLSPTTVNQRTNIINSTYSSPPLSALSNCSSTALHCGLAWLIIKAVLRVPLLLIEFFLLTQLLSGWCCFSVMQSCLTLSHPVDCSTPGLPVPHHLLELAQTHVHWVGDAIQPSHPLSSPSPPAFNISQHQGLF